MRGGKARPGWTQPRVWSCDPEEGGWDAPKKSASVEGTRENREAPDPVFLKVQEKKKTDIKGVWKRGGLKESCNFYRFGRGQMPGSWQIRKVPGLPLKGRGKASSLTENWPTSMGAGKTVPRKEKSRTFKGP